MKDDNAPSTSPCSRSHTLPPSFRPNVPTIHRSAIFAGFLFSYSSTCAPPPTGPASVLPSTPSCCAFRPLPSPPHHRTPSFVPLLRPVTPPRPDVIPQSLPMASRPAARSPSLAAANPSLPRPPPARKRRPAPRRPPSPRSDLSSIKSGPPYARTSTRSSPSSPPPPSLPKSAPRAPSPHRHPSLPLPQLRARRHLPPTSRTSTCVSVSCCSRASSVSMLSPQKESGRRLGASARAPSRRCRAC